MAESDNELKTLAQRMRTEGWEYKRQTKRYVSDIMKYFSQEKLMGLLDELNYKELQMIAGCGIPGDAHRYSVNLLHKKKLELELFIEQGGQKATAIVNATGTSEGDDLGAPGV